MFSDALNAVERAWWRLEERIATRRVVRRANAAQHIDSRWRARGTRTLGTCRRRDRTTETGPASDLFTIGNYTVPASHIVLYIRVTDKPYTHHDVSEAKALMLII